MKKVKTLAFVIMAYALMKKEVINVFVVPDSVVMIVVKTSKSVYQNHARTMGHVLIKWHPIFVNANLDLKVINLFLFFRAHPKQRARSWCLLASKLQPKMNYVV